MDEYVIAAEWRGLYRLAQSQEDSGSFFGCDLSNALFVYLIVGFSRRVILIFLMNGLYQSEKW